ncbi:MAG: hypothetical protein OEW67_14405 [Cyclobacteriaceae bacterium]|nr:hypothetical protein [Cyclobacteriaceae bacterium]
MTGGGFGALDAMNKSLRNNRGLVKKVSAFERMKGYSSALKGKKIELTEKKLTPEELKKLRLKTIKEDRIHTLKRIVQMIVIFGVLVFLLTLLISGPLNK